MGEQVLLENKKKQKKRKRQEKSLLNPTNDYVFKRLFGQNRNSDILAELISAVLQRKVTDVVVKEEKMTADTINGKEMILDIKATLGDETKVNIEMQVRNEYNMIERASCYTFKRYLEDFEEGEDYIELKKTISINFLNYKMLKHRKNYIHIAESTFRSDEYNNAEKHGDPYEIYYIELPKFRRSKIDLNLKLHRWLSIIKKNIKKSELEEIAKMDEKIKLAADKLYELSQNENEREIAEKRAKYWSGYKSDMRGSREEGREEGRVEGREETLRSFVKNMLNMGNDIETISQATGLSVEEISKLQTE